MLYEVITKWIHLQRYQQGGAPGRGEAGDLLYHPHRGDRSSAH